MNGLLARALLAVLVVPGTVAFLVPLALIALAGTGWSGHAVGLVPLASGVTILLVCVREFYVAGRGTLAPWEPPRRLVVTGPYRFSRNPMYVGVLLILCGWAVSFGSSLLALYAGAIALLFHLRVVSHEEPSLARAHGQDWTRYKARVRRWIGRERGAPNPSGHAD